MVTALAPINKSLLSDLEAAVPEESAMNLARSNPGEVLSAMNSRFAFHGRIAPSTERER